MKEPGYPLGARDHFEALARITELEAHLAAEPERMLAVVERCAKVADVFDNLPHLPGACGAAIRTQGTSHV